MIESSEVVLSLVSDSILVMMWLKDLKLPEMGRNIVPFPYWISSA